MPFGSEDVCAFGAAFDCRMGAAEVGQYGLAGQPFYVC